MAKIKLPPVPVPVFYGRTLGEDLYTHNQLRAYAKEAIEYDRLIRKAIKTERDHDGEDSW
jgi:hypothetical protein